MGVKKQDIYDLIDRIEGSGITRLKVRWDGLELEVEQGSSLAAPAMMVPAPAAPAAAAPALGAESVAAGAPAAEQKAPAAADAPEGTYITAPLVGTFYVAPAPDQDPFVQPGDKVKRGDTVCLLEAMKMMSEVEAPCDCTIEEVLVADGELVEFGAALIRYRED